MKQLVSISLTEEDIIVAREMAMARGFTCSGGKLGPEIRGNISTFVEALIHEEKERVVPDDQEGGEDA